MSNTRTLAEDVVADVIRSVADDLLQSGWGRYGDGDDLEEEAARLLREALVDMVRKQLEDGDEAP